MRNILSLATARMAIALTLALMTQAADQPPTTVNAVDFVAASDGIRRQGAHVTAAPGENWFSFDVDIPVAGRYQVAVKARADSATTLQVEDYIQNPDGRNYDITSAMAAPSGPDFGVVSRDGSPLNAGRHKMKLHVKGGAAAVQSLQFTLLKAHELTPFTLKQNVTGGEWVLVWSDEFEKDGRPDPRTWAYDFGDWGWGNAEPQYYTVDRPENARCEGGRLIVEARRDRPGAGWSSARLTTRGRMSLLYGRIEVRARVPAGDGTWCAIWLLGDDYRDEVSWPYCGEVDLLENVGREIDDRTGDGRNHFSCHTRAYYFKQGNQITSVVPVRNMTGEFHDYAMEWTPGGITMFLDGKKAYTYDKTANELEYPFNKPQNLIINMAIGGGMGGTIDPALQSQRMEVEYVRVYGRR